MPAISSLTDVTGHDAFVPGVLASADLNSAFSDFQTAINNLNDVVADLESNYAGATAPSDNTVRGKLWYDTGNDYLKVDPDGAGCDDEVLTRLTAYSLSLATGGTATFKLSGAIDVNTTDDPLTATGDFTQTYTLPANTLDADGKYVHVVWWGTRSGAAGTFSLQPYFGSAAGTAVASTISSLTGWIIEMWVVRTGTAAQDFAWKCTFNSDATGSTTLVSAGTLTEDETATIAIKLNLSAISAGTVTQSAMITELYN